MELDSKKIYLGIIATCFNKFIWIKLKLRNWSMNYLLHLILILPLAKKYDFFPLTIYGIPVLPLCVLLDGLPLFHFIKQCNPVVFCALNHILIEATCPLRWNWILIFQCLLLTTQILSICIVQLTSDACVNSFDFL